MLLSCKPLGTTLLLCLPLSLSAQNPAVAPLLAEHQPLTQTYPTDLVLEAQPDWAGDLGGAVTRGYEMLKDSALDAAGLGGKALLASMLTVPMQQLANGVDPEVSKQLVSGLIAGTSSGVVDGVLFQPSWAQWIASMSMAVGTGIVPQLSFVNLALMLPSVLATRFGELAYYSGISGDTVPVVDDDGLGVNLTLTVPGKHNPLGQPVYLDIQVNGEKADDPGDHHAFQAVAQSLARSGDSPTLRLFPGQSSSGLRVHWQLIRNTGADPLQTITIPDAQGEWFTDALVNKTLVQTPQSLITWLSGAAPPVVYNPIAPAILAELARQLDSGVKEDAPVSLAAMSVKQSGHYTAALDLEGATLFVDDFSSQGKAAPRLTLKATGFEAIHEDQLTTLDEQRIERYPNVLLGNRPQDPHRAQLEALLLKVVLSKALYDLGSRVLHPQPAKTIELVETEPQEVWHDAPENPASEYDHLKRPVPMPQTPPDYEHLHSQPVYHTLEPPKTTDRPEPLYHTLEPEPVYETIADTEASSYISWDDVPPPLPPRNPSVDHKVTPGFYAVPIRTRHLPGERYVTQGLPPYPTGPVYDEPNNGLGPVLEEALYEPLPEPVKKSWLKTVKRTLTKPFRRKH